MTYSPTPLSPSLLQAFSGAGRVNPWGFKGELHSFTLPFEGGLDPGRRALTPTWASDLAPGSKKLVNRTRFIGLEVQSSDVLTGLATLAGVSRVAAQIVGARAGQWQRDIREATPKGAPVRIQPKQYNLKYTPATTLEMGYVSTATKTSKTWTTRLKNDMERGVRFMEKDKDVFTTKGGKRNVDIKLATMYCKQLGLPLEDTLEYAGTPYKLGPLAGRLEESIKVVPESKEGFCTVVAYSDSYYAWFVEEGYMSVLKPVGELVTKGIYAKVPLEQMGKGGDYEYLEGFAHSYSGVTKSSAELPDQGGRLHQVDMSTVGRDLVKLKKRSTPVSMPGHHMFAIGTRKFITSLEADFAPELSRLVELAEKQNIAFDPMMRQWRGKTGQGNKGSFMARDIVAQVGGFSG